MPENCPFDIDDPSIIDDPYTKYAELRATCPVGFSETRGGFWYVADYESVRAGFRNPEMLSNAEIKVPAAGDPMGKYIPVQLDGPIARAMAGTPRPTLFADSHGELSPRHS